MHEHSFGTRSRPETMLDVHVGQEVFRHIRWVLLPQKVTVTEITESTIVCGRYVFNLDGVQLDEPAYLDTKEQ